MSPKDRLVYLLASAVVLVYAYVSIGRWHGNGVDHTRQWKKCHEIWSKYITKTMDEAEGNKSDVAKMEPSEKEWETVSKQTGIEQVELDAHESKDERQFLVREITGIQRFLNPKLFEDPSTLHDIAQRLREGGVVVIRNAFAPHFAEAVYRDLEESDAFELYQNYLDDGFWYQHHNIYEPEDFPETVMSAFEMFDHDDTKKLMSDLSGRDCYGETQFSASHYQPGDHSLPHSDHVDGRSLAFVWHLTKDWRPEWGGAFYWCPEHNIHSTIHASFNTLTLFSVTRDASHFVTKVSNYATEKRFALNGWWKSSWMPSLDDNLEEILSDPEVRRLLTMEQYETIDEMVYNDEWGVDPQRRASLRPWIEMAQREAFYDVREASVVHTVEF